MVADAVGLPVDGRTVPLLVGAWVTVRVVVVTGVLVSDGRDVLRVVTVRVTVVVTDAPAAGVLAYVTVNRNISMHVAIVVIYSDRPIAIHAIGPRRK